MRWPFARDEADPAQGHGDLAAGPVVELHRSPGFEASLSHVREDRPCGVLDLGPAQAQNVEFFSRFGCRLRIVDLLNGLSDPSGDTGYAGTNPARLLDELLPVDLQPFDLVLTWTVFDHVEPETAALLAARLARLTRTGARLHAIIAMSGTTGDIGLDFAIRDRATLEYRPGGPTVHRSAPFTPASFGQLLKGFAIDRSVVLRHGYQEYVAVRLDSGAESDS